MHIFITNFDDFCSFLSPNDLYCHLILLLAFLETFLTDFSSTDNNVEDLDLTLELLGKAIKNLWDFLSTKTYKLNMFIILIREQKNFQFLPKLFEEVFILESDFTYSNEDLLFFIFDSIVNYYFWDEYMILTLDFLNFILK